MHSPFKAIFRKEWKQSSVLRRVAILLTVLLPPFVMMVAESASRGWVPMFSIKSYDVTQLFMDAVPMILVLGWAFFAALFTAQAFAGDRSTGNESFLLERPVLRSLTWRARLAAVTANGLIVLLGGWLIWLGYFLYLGDPIEGTYLKLSGLLLGVGLAVMLASICGGMAATAFLDSPMIGVLGGLLLAALPAGAAVFLGGLSPYAVLFRIDYDTFPSPLITLSRLPVGMILPVLLYPVYVAVSWFALCRGEPAGRGSRARGAKVLVPSIFGVLVLFLIMAPLAVRANVNAYMDNGRIYPSPDSSRTILTGGYMASGGWLVDTETGEKLRFFGVPTDMVTWSADGRFVAAVTHGNSIRWSSSWAPRIDLVEAETGETMASLPLSENEWIRDLVWIGEELIIVTIDHVAWEWDQKPDKAGEMVRFFMLKRGMKEGSGYLQQLSHDLPIPGPGWYDWRIYTPAAGVEEIVLAIAKDPIGLNYDKASDVDRDRSVILHKVRLEGNRLASVPTVEVPHGLSGGNYTLSRSGRYFWTVVPKVGPEQVRGLLLFDLVRGEEVDLGSRIGVFWPNWMAGDELVWVQRDKSDHVQLHSWRPEAGLNVVFDGGSDRLGLDTSPNGQTALITGYERLDDPEVPHGPGKRTGTWLYEAGSGRVVPMETEYAGYISGRFYTNWADPDTLLRSGEDGMYFESVREPGKTVEIR
ncbi:MAG: hypothetical protein IFK94_06740 [Acidobacteria bacterium]|uniref:Uncharacterized protein n=1 Tax=Candidatus Polarisedimenticola svalbardensis TaxID=2886004 RepID=A0A8J7C2I2_9BACT|nr:hypothetical protein [Candidatus Polarisedimenticola svalbardensis]